MGEKDKYDTNPLDPDFVRRTEELGGATRDVARTTNEQARRSADAEAPTRRYDTPPPLSYPSIFVPPTYTPPRPYEATGAPATAQPPSSRTVPGISLPENVTTVLPYIPIYIGAVAAAVELFLVPRSEVRTRFHAAQGLALHLAVLAAGFLFRIADFLVDNTLGGISSVMLGVAWTLFSVAAFVFFIISMIRVYKGEEHRLTPLADAARWLNENIEPRK